MKVESKEILQDTYHRQNCTPDSRIFTTVSRISENAGLENPKICKK